MYGGPDCAFPAEVDGAPNVVLLLLVRFCCFFAGPSKCSPPLLDGLMEEGEGMTSTMSPMPMPMANKCDRVCVRAWMRKRGLVGEASCGDPVCLVAAAARWPSLVDDGLDAWGSCLCLALLACPPLCCSCSACLLVAQRGLALVLLEWRGKKMEGDEPAALLARRLVTHHGCRATESAAGSVSAMCHVALVTCQRRRRARANRSCVLLSS